MTTTGKKSPSRDRNRFLGRGLKLVQALFPTLLITYLFLILLETIFEGSVSHYINLNQLLIVVIAVGITAVLTAPGKAERAKGERLTTKGIFIIICAGIGGAAIIWYKTQEIGWLSYVISAVGGGLIVLLSMLIWQGDEGGAQRAEVRNFLRRDVIMVAWTRLTGAIAVRRMKGKIARVVELSYFQIVVIFFIYVISVVSGGLIALLSMLIRIEDEGIEQESGKRATEIELKTQKEATRAVKERAKRETKEALERARKEAIDTLVRGKRQAKEAIDRAKRKAEDVLEKARRGAKEALDRGRKGKATKEKIARVVELSYFQIVVIFLILVLLSGLNILSLPINYQLFACVLPLLAVPILLRFKPSEEKRMPAVSYILLAAFLFTLCIRLLPFVRSSIPLGYDPGFYKYAMELYSSALPLIPEAGLTTWVKEMYPQGLFVLSDALHIVAGTDAMDHINYLFPFLGALVVFPLFVVTRSLFGQRIGLIASLLYAISYTQYTAFTWLYFKNVLGLMFLLLAIYSLEKKKYVLMALMFAALGIFHRPEFLLFALILIPYFMLHRRREIILAVLATGVLIVPFWLPRWDANLGILSAALGTPSGGTFFDFNTYTIMSLAYLPFALMGAIYLAIKRNWNSILFYFVISSVVVIFQLFFFRRFIIPLDIAVVILAAVGINYTLLHKREIWRVVGVGVGILLLVATGFPTVSVANNVRPQISEEQMETVEWIRENAEDDAYVLATSNDAPWVLGWSGRRVIAPGLFEWDVHNKDEWFSFFGSKDPEVAKEFLDVYDGPIYIYYSKNLGNYLGLEKFQGDYFRKVYDNGAVVYKYPGDS